MDKKENNLQEQEAPLKNTDNAFVQVSEDGSPLIPDEKQKAATDNKTMDSDKE